MKSASKRAIIPQRELRIRISFVVQASFQLSTQHPSSNQTNHSSFRSSLVVPLKYGTCGSCFFSGIINEDIIHKVINKMREI